jgi:glycosyltransferase involved in cell wall biosynthesis
MELNRLWENVHRTKSKHFLSLSKLEQRKNVHGLIDAYISYVSIVNFPYPLIIVGDPGYNSYSRDVIKRIEELNSRGFEIKFIQSAKDALISKLFEEAAALVFTSFFEGFGLPPIEAMAAGVPVISSKTGIIKEELSEYVTIITENTPNKLAKIMKDITENPEAYNKLATIGKEKVKHVVNNEEIRDEWIKLINKYLRQSSRDFPNKLLNPQLQ